MRGAMLTGSTHNMYGYETQKILNITSSKAPPFESLRTVNMFDSVHREWCIKRTESKEEFIASIEVVYDRGVRNIFDDELNTTWKGHCQWGTNQKISVLTTIEFIANGGITRKCKKKEIVKKWKKWII